jgi:hypothetical protein
LFFFIRNGWIGGWCGAGCNLFLEGGDDAHDPVDTADMQHVVEARTVTSQHQIGTMLLSPPNFTDQRYQACRVDELHASQVDDDVPAGGQILQRRTERRDGSGGQLSLQSQNGTVVRRHPDQERQSHGRLI